MAVPVSYYLYTLSPAPREYITVRNCFLSYLGPNLVSFNRTVVPYEISKVNFRVETKILDSMSEEI
jgi:hypothetical protein